MVDTLYIDLIDRRYPIYIQKGIFADLGREIKNIYSNKKIAVITDTNINKLYGTHIEKILLGEGFIPNIITIEPGEKSKSLKTLEFIYDELLDFEIDRGDLILVFGGGVVGDLGGFAAATFLRGVPFIQIPTTLLAQVDSSVGGKVAINLRKGKNLVGNFYHPLAVFIDPELLKTLDKKYFNDGIAEIIKYGAIKDRDLFDSLLNKYGTEESLFCDIEDIIYRSCSIKKNIVEKDEKDKGHRMLLNFGHTIGHGIEKYFNYEGYTHGEAVAIGMYWITKNSEKLGKTKLGTSDRIENILIKYQLPYQISGIDKKRLMKNIQHDKKAFGGEMHIVLLEEIGKGYIQKIKKEKLEGYVTKQGEVK